MDKYPSDKTYPSDIFYSLAFKIFTVLALAAFGIVAGSPIGSFAVLF